MALPAASQTASPSTTTTQPSHILPAPFTNSQLELLTQGAEALVYRTHFLTPNTPVVLKYRPPKPYRHPILDKRLTKLRILAEARVLVRVRKEGVPVPAVLGGDWDNGWLMMEFVEGKTVRRVLDEWVERGAFKEERSASIPEEGEGDNDAGKQNQGGGGGDGEILDLMRRIGRAVAKLHDLAVCHGDLTTSNLMLRAPPPPKEEASPEGSSQKPLAGRQTVSTMREAAMSGEEPPVAAPSKVEPARDSSLAGDIVLIDFGLAAQATKQSQDEDRAVDLYVLERAFAATHPSAEYLFQEVLKAYGESFSDAKRVLKRLADVRLRGRKRSMIG
ncbi:kinase-like protein [Aaosphaeria arxii CBS 175.79]|uniref:EKC/KEOPS complex subunit BUD32 n=1 Tax=Aaosphaeria arxii CBS 175.79 TaxID=1450172 RepID=A0A6A5XPE3_9PLEO|nr:kinase-like protein [Aaosphaeria arxii CBS 175.79]KAF2014813.1 kinase-like protein [Aaosphaeria arxii CBS 175.79]